MPTTSNYSHPEYTEYQHLIEELDYWLKEIGKVGYYAYKEDPDQGLDGLDEFNVMRFIERVEEVKIQLRKIGGTIPFWVWKATIPA